MQTEQRQVESAGKGRYRVLDCAKGIAIVLVVIGHWIPEFSPLWYKYIVRVIYTFHMPLFLAASGFLYIATKKDESYLKFIRKKFDRLIVPYISTSIIIITLKLIADYRIGQSDMVSLYSYLAILWKPAAGYFLWFIWTLWTMFLVIPLFRTRLSRLILFIATVALHFSGIPMPEIFCLSQTSLMMVYFMLGVVIYDYRPVLTMFDRVPTLLVAGIFAVSEMLYLVKWPEVRVILPLLGIWLMIRVSAGIERCASSNIRKTVAAVAASSYIIYLFHTTFEGFAKSLLLSVMPGMRQSELLFAVASVLIILSGVIIPMVLHNYVFSRNRVLCYLFGLKRQHTISAEKNR